MRVGDYPNFSARPALHTFDNPAVTGVSLIVVVSLTTEQVNARVTLLEDLQILGMHHTAAEPPACRACFPGCEHSLDPRVMGSLSIN